MPQDWRGGRDYTVHRGTLTLSVGPWDRLDPRAQACLPTHEETKAQAWQREGAQDAATGTGGKAGPS